MDDNEIITSFANPNYTLNSVDALNSNNLPPTTTTRHLHDNTTQYYDNDDITDVYETINNAKTNTNGGIRRNDYYHSDTVSMGLSGDDYLLTSHSTDSLDNDNPFQNASRGGGGDVISSPAESEGVFSMDSTATTPADSIVAVEHTEQDEGEHESAILDSTTTRSTGFLGYYSNMGSVEDEDGEDIGLLKKPQEELAGGKQSEEKGVHSHTPLLKGDNKSRLQSFDPTKDISSPGGESNDSGIQADVQHVRVNDDVYAVVDKKSAKKQVEEKKKEDEAELPPGWEKHQDENGAYYWHIKSGTIQREPPPPPSPSAAKAQAVTAKTSSSSSNASSSSAAESGPETPSEKLLHQFEGHALNYASESLKSIKSSSKKDKDTVTKEDYPIRFAVRSLGWVEIAEDDLTPERSSKAVNKCIVDLSLGRNDINDVVGRWGDGKDLYMDLDEENLTLTDPTDMTLLNIQGIHSIRVWGVGRDNGRDFAYVARDRSSRKHMCHVFRCDTPARQIANTLRDICKKIMMERSLQHSMQAMSTTQKSSSSASNASRPNNLPNLEKMGQANGQKITFQDLIKNTSFPTPMEEPKKVLRCHYLGEVVVGRPTGVDTLNSAMEKVYARVPPETWNFASVAVAPSTITVTEHNNPDNVMAECRVRFLSFMGIAQRNVRLCSFIMHTAQDTYIAHVFHCEPSAGALCKTIEAACKLRYQKCLDAHHKQMQNAKQTASQQQSKGFLKTVFGSMSRGSKNKVKT